MSEETVGKIAVKLQETADNKHSVVEQMEENLTDFEKNVIFCTQKGREEHKSDFYVVVITKKEPLVENVIRNLFFHRKSCPTPEYDQIVYHYCYNSDNLRFLWVVPDKETCIVYLGSKDTVAPEEYGLLKFVMDFDSGDLDRLSRKLNGEKGDTKYLENLNVVLH